MSIVLSAENVSMQFGKIIALNELSCTFDQGKIYGLLGPNASGKTTFLKICAALIKSYDGTVSIDGIKPGFSTKSKVAYLPDGDYFLQWMNVGDALEFFDDFFPDFERAKAEELVKQMELEKTRRIINLSKGMKARMKLTVILSRKARLYLLDEAFDGVDPVTREKLIDIILATFSEDSTMILATHHIDYVEKLLDSVKLIHKGQIIRETSAEDLREQRGLSIGEYYMEVFRNEKVD